MSEVLTRRPTLTLDDLDHDADRDRPWHIHEGDAASEPPPGAVARALCGAIYVARPGRWVWEVPASECCVVCDALAAEQGR